jgi:methyl acetate hydrolase
MIQTTAIDELLENAVADGTLLGVIAVAGDRNGTIYEGVFGRLSIAREEPVRADTMLAIASMTKAITSVAALQLIEQGRLELEQTVASVLPAFGELQVLDGFDGDTPRLRAPTSQATIRQLLTHTSGLGYWFGDADLLRYHELEGLPDPLLARRSALDGVPLVCDPGTRWTYGTSIDARTLDGGLELSPMELPREPEFYSGGGGAFSTAGDYLRFMRAILGDGELDGERVLRPETVRLMFTDHLAGAPLPEIMRSALPELMNEVPALPFKQGWGLGLSLLLEDIPGMRRSGTGNWAGLFTCYYWIDPGTGVAAALLTQVLPFFDELIIQTLLQFNVALFSAVSENTVAA